MAKWGEGDPRWIVEERADATNVNNWHWTEKQASGWSRERITSLLSAVELKDDKIGHVKIAELTSIEGEALINNRKAKLIFFYEWVIKGKWVGKAIDGEHEIKGDFEIPNLSEENDPDEIDVTVSYTDNSEHDKNEAIKELFRKRGTEMIQKQLAIYIKELKEDYGRDLILPTKDGLPVPVKKPDQVKSVTRINKTVIVNQNTSSQSDRLNNLKSLNFQEEMKCTPSDFYDSLTREELVCRFTQDKATVCDKVGGHFSMFGDNVEGEFVELVKEKLIKQKWRFRSWPKDHYSSVTFNIEKKDDSVLVKLDQTGIPADEYEKVREGWKRYYFEPMRRVLGFGSSLY